MGIKELQPFDKNPENSCVVNAESQYKVLIVGKTGLNFI